MLRFIYDLDNIRKHGPNYSVSHNNSFHNTHIQKNQQHLVDIASAEDI